MHFNFLFCRCQVDSKPKSQTFRWLFNSSETRFEIPSAESVMSFGNYKATSGDEHGQVLCWASNDLGEQANPCVFHVVPLGSPQPPTNCQVRTTCCTPREFWQKKSFPFSTTTIWEHASCEFRNLPRFIMLRSFRLSYILQPSFLPLAGIACLTSVASFSRISIGRASEWVSEWPEALLASSLSRSPLVGRSVLASWMTFFKRQPIFNCMCKRRHGISSKWTPRIILKCSLPKALDLL